MGNHRKRKKAEAYEAVKALATQFPEAFRPNGPRKPLKVGIDVDLILHGVNGTVTLIALKSYVRSPSYLAAMTEGAVRVDPFGQPAGVVTAQDAADAKRRLIEKYLSKVEPKPKPAHSPPLRAHSPRTAVR